MRTVTASGGGLASGGDIHITQTGLGPLIVGGVHGVPPEDFQWVSAKLGITEAALTSFFKVLEKQKVAPEDLDSYWARELLNLGHSVKLMPAQYVKGYVKGNKNDGNDPADATGSVA